MYEGLEAIRLSRILLDVAGIVMGGDHDDLVGLLASAVGICLQRENVVFVLVGLRHIVLHELHLAQHLSALERDSSLGDNPRAFEEGGNGERLFLGSSGRNGDGEKKESTDSQILHGRMMWV